MPWVKFSDDWYDDPELIEAGPAAMLLWPVLISWSARNLTDGKIPAGQVRRLVDWHTLGIEPEQAIAPLVAVGRLQDIAGGYQITNYLRYQPSREDVLEKREAERLRKASARNPSGQTAVSAPRPTPPVPVPVPDESSSSSSSSVTTEGLPPDLWTRVAEKQATLTTNPIKNRRAWLAQAARNARADLEERAIWLSGQYDLPASKLVDALVAGGTPAWLQHHKRSAA